MANYITPQYIANFETNLRFVMTNAWSRTLKRLWYPRLMNVTTTGSALEYVEWMLETARIGPTGPKGAQMNYDPLVAISQTLRHEHFGNGLELFRSDIEDDKIARAPKWADDTGSASAYWPQRLLVELLQNGKSTTLNGKSNTAYDGLSFFNTAHPVNPYDDSLGTYSNLHAGTSFTPTNLARVVAYAESIQHGGAAPMGAMPTITLFPTNFRLRASQTLNADSYTDVLNTLSAAAASNTIKTAYEFEPPIFAPELNTEPTVWYVGTPADADAFDAPFGYLEREPFSVNTFSPMDQAALSRMQVFRWENRGRNGAFYGHPYRWHRCEASGVQPSYLSSLSI